MLCEEFIDGDELTCTVLGEGADAVALPVILIRAPEGNYDYQNKYFGNSTQYLCPCGLPAEEEAAIRRSCWRPTERFGCRGWGRGDVMLRASDVYGNSLAPGANIAVWPYWGGSGQQWSFTASGGYQTIKSRLSGLPLDVLNLSTANDAKLIQWNATGAGNQQWSLIRLK